MVAPSVMHLVGVAGGESGANALLHKFRCSSSVKVKQKIWVQLQQLSVDYHILTSESGGGTDDQLLTFINGKSQSPKRYDFSLFRTILLFSSFMLPSFFFLMMLVIPHIRFSSPYVFLQVLFETMAGYVVLLLVITFIPRYYEIYQRSIGLSKAVKDHSESISNFLSIDSNINSFYIQALIMRNLFENTDLILLKPLNRSQLNKLHTLLCPPNVYKLQLSAFQQPPLPEIGTMPAILHGLVFLGDNSSVKVIEKFYKTTENEEHKRVALECLNALNARLTEKPEQLLRASSLSGDALLRASQQSITTDELLKPMVAEEPIVFPQTIETDKIEVNNQL